MEREDWKIKFCVAVVSILVFIFVLYPLWRVAASASLPDIVHFFATPYFARPFMNSIILVVVVGALGACIGFIMAYSVERAKIPGARLFDIVGTIPVIAPPFVVAIASIMLFGRNGLVVRHLLGGRELFSVYGFWGLVITETLAYFPTAFLVLKGTLASIHPTFEDASRSLGASRWHTFWRITVPLALPGIGYWRIV